MREKVIEQKLVAEVKRRGGICPKWVSPGFDGMPDRIVLLPGRHFGLMEVKAPGERTRPLQVSRHRLGSLISSEAGAVKPAAVSDAHPEP